MYLLTYLITYLLIKARMYCAVHVLGLRYFLVGRHEDTVDENDEHHQQAEERACRHEDTVDENDQHHQQAEERACRLRYETINIVTALKCLLNS